LRTLEKLRQHFKGQLAPAALRQIHTELRQESEKAMKRFTKKKTKRSATRTLRPMEKKFRLKICGKGCKALGRGVKKAYAAGQRAYRAAESRARKLSPLAQTRQRPVVSREIARPGLAGADGGAGEGVEDALGPSGRRSRSRRLEPRHSRR